MKFEKEGMEERLVEALKDANVLENTQNRVIQAFRLIHKSYFPVFNSLYFESVLPDDKANPLRVEFSNDIEGNDGFGTILFTINEESITISDDHKYVELELFEDGQRLAKFKYDNDIICVSGKNEEHVGFPKVDLKVYTHAWNDEDGLDVEELEPDFSCKANQISTRFTEDFLGATRYVTCETLINLDDFLAFGIYYRDYVYRRSLDVFDKVTKTK